ncbi:MAG: hypothetical protein AB1591_01565 [Pseudomonadota bacterium]
MHSFKRVCLLYGLLFTASAHAAPVQEGITRHSVDPDTGIPTWEVDTQGVHLRLTLITPEQARAFMLNRGMDKQSVDEFAHACVYMTVVRNEGKQAIEHNLADWHYLPEGSGRPKALLTKHDWLTRWQPRNFLRPVKLAFEWSQFPVEQTFAPGDWNQGMTTFALPAGSRFDVLYRWKQNGKLHEGKMQNVQCPPSFD